MARSINTQKWFLVVGGKGHFKQGQGPEEEGGFRGRSLYTDYKTIWTKQVKRTRVPVAISHGRRELFIFPREPHPVSHTHLWRARYMSLRLHSPAVRRLFRAAALSENFSWNAGTGFVVNWHEVKRASYRFRQVKAPGSSGQGLHSHCDHLQLSIEKPGATRSSSSLQWSLQLLRSALACRFSCALLCSRSREPAALFSRL